MQRCSDVHETIVIWLLITITKLCCYFIIRSKRWLSLVPVDININQFTCTQLYERVYIFARKWSVVATTYSAPFQLKKNLATPVIKQIHAQAHTSAIFSFLRTCACFVVLHKPKSYESQNPQVTMHSKTKIVKKDSRFTLFKLTFLIPAPEMIWWRMLGYNRLILIVLLQLDK